MIVSVHAHTTKLLLNVGKFGYNRIGRRGRTALQPRLPKVMSKEFFFYLSSPGTYVHTTGLPLIDHSFGGAGRLTR